jgi:hypothetical protein
MLQTLRKNNKKIMAVLGVFLMIAFLASDARVMERMGAGGKDVIGKIAGEPVYAVDYRQAQNEWDTIKRLGIGQNSTGPDGQQRPEFYSIAQISFLNRLGPAMQQNPFMAFSLSQKLVSDIDHTTYLLLLREAKKMNVQPGRDEVQETITNLGESGVDPVAREQAITNWLTVMAAFDRVASAPKVGPALSLRLAAQQQQQISLALVEFRAEQFLKDVPEPTRDQLVEFFNKYRDENPETNESGFGYRYPHRVRIQYLRIPREKLKNTVTLEDMYGHFRNNPDRYEEDPTTQPTTGPTTRTAIGPDFAATRPTTAPTTLPSLELAKLPMAERWRRLPDKAKDKVRDDISFQMAEQMASAIRQRFAADWPDYRMAARKANTIAPPDAVSSLGVPYHQQTYLIRMREQVERLKESRGVMPETVEEGGLLSKKQLTDLPGIGQSFSQESFYRTSFPEYAIDLAEPFMTEDQHKQAMENRRQTLALFQASPPLRDNFGNIYIFRLTAAETSHPPATLDEVESQVRNDWRMNEAMKKAKDAAKQLVESAKTRGGLQQALNAGNTQQKLITTKLFSEGVPTLEEYKLGNENATTRFTRAAFSLLGEKVRTGNEHPADVFEVPQAGVVIAAQLEKATPTVKSEMLDFMVSLMQQRLDHQRHAELLVGWMTPKNVHTRMSYVPETSGDDKPQQQDPLSVPRNPLRG